MTCSVVNLQGRIITKSFIEHLYLGRTVVQHYQASTLRSEIPAQRTEQNQDAPA